jgi:hypothetical protein
MRRHVSDSRGTSWTLVRFQTWLSFLQGNAAMELMTTKSEMIAADGIQKLDDGESHLPSAGVTQKMPPMLFQT